MEQATLEQPTLTQPTQTVGGARTIEMTAPVEERFVITNNEPIVVEPPAVVIEPAPAAVVAPAEAAPIVQPAPAIAPVVAAPVVAPEPTKQEEVTFLSELGISKDDKGAKEILAAWKAGEFDKYVQAKFTNYDAIDDMTLIRQKFDKDFTHLSKEDKDVLFQHTLETTYNITGDADLDKIAHLKIKNEAATIRQGLKKAAEDWKFEGYQPQVTQQDEQQKAQKEQNDRVMAQILNDPKLIAFEANRTLKFGEGDEAMNYEVPAELNVREAAFDIGKFYSMFVGADGQFDMNGLIETVAYAHDRASFQKALVAHGKSAQEREHAKALINPKPTTVQAPPTVTDGAVKFSDNGNASTPYQVIRSK